MKHIKRLLLAALLLTTAIKGWGADFEVDGIYYNITNTNPNEVEVTRHNGYSGDVVIPTSVNHDGTDYTVKRIGYEAFYHCLGLAAVSIPNSVTSIGENAFFECWNLASANIPNSVTTIEAGSFYNCWSLTDITFPNSVTNIGFYSFYGCTGLTSIVIPDSVTSLEEGSFHSCTGLESVTIGNSITSIERNAFYECTSLASVSIGNSVENIGEGVFRKCTALTSVAIPNSVTSIGESAFFNVPNIMYNGTATGSPWGARSVNGFVDGNLVYADDTKTELLACSSAASGEITIPNSVTSIGSAAFLDCTALTSVFIPNSVENIGNGAFSNCTSLSFITIPDSVTSIADYTFSRCSGLSSVAIGKSVDSIGNFAFYYCRGLTSVEIPNSVTSIGNSAFNGCSSLVSVSIGRRVANIDTQAFWYTGLTSVIIKAETPPSIGVYAFQPQQNYELFVPCGALEAYQGNPDWPSYFTSMTDNVFPYDITVASNNESHGYANIIQQPDCASNEATVKAEPNQGCTFIGWTVDGEFVSTANPYTFPVEDDMELVANFNGSVGIDEQSTNQVLLFPNPTNNIVHIENKGNDIKRIAVYDILGTLHYEKETKESNPSISLVGFAQGTYLLKVEFTDGSHGWSRFVIAR